MYFIKGQYTQLRFIASQQLTIRADFHRWQIVRPGQPDPRAAPRSRTLARTFLDGVRRVQQLKQFFRVER